MLNPAMIVKVYCLLIVDDLLTPFGDINKQVFVQWDYRHPLEFTQEKALRIGEWRCLAVRSLNHPLACCKGCSVSRHREYL